MQIFRDDTVLPQAFRGAALVLGNFDGVHRGHAALIAHARSLAPRVGVLTFSPHPRLVTQPDQPSFLLSSSDAKMAVLAQMGVDFCVVLSFTAVLAATAAEDFVADILDWRIGARHLVTGQDFRFGSRRKGDVDLLRRMEARHGFTAHAVAPVLDGAGTRFSSSAIRACLRQGDLDGAAWALGRSWSLDIPALSLADDCDGATAIFRFGSYLKPAAGLYAVRVGQAEVTLSVSQDDDLGRVHVRGADAVSGTELRLEFLSFLGAEPERAPHVVSGHAHFKHAQA